MHGAMQDEDHDLKADAANCTPELCTCAIGSDAAQQKGAAAVAPIFSLFRPAVQRKVRH